MELPSQPGLTLLVYTAPQHSPTADGLTLLASWAATAERTGELADYGQHRNGSRNHDELFPDRISTLAQTDPEFIERFDNFAFDEVLADSDLDTRTRLMVQVFDFLHAANDGSRRTRGAAPAARPVDNYPGSTARARAGRAETDRRR
jgi:hypothetical protein